MKYGHYGVAAVLVILAPGTNVGLMAQTQSASRTLSVEQATIKNVVPPSKSTLGDGEPLEVLAWVDRPDSTYARGERVRMFVETNKDAYVTILNVDPEGKTTVLFPNRYQSDNRIRGARAVEIPTPGSGARVVVGGAVGAELLKVIASTEPVALFEAMQLAEAGSFQQVRAEPRRIARSLVVAMNQDRPSGSFAAPDRTGPSGGTAASRPVSATEWAMCHQTIATVVAVPTAAQQRTRSLQVLRTQDDGGSVKCDDATR
jgi:hypothetical protein